MTTLEQIRDGLIKEQQDILMTNKHFFSPKHNYIEVAKDNI